MQTRPELHKPHRFIFVGVNQISVHVILLILPPVWLAD
jgi:hypothetical protein